MTELVRSRGLSTVMSKSVLKPGGDDDPVAIPLTPTLSPLAEAEIGGDDNAGALLEPAQQMEQQRPA